MTQNSPQTPISVLIVEDDAVTRKALCLSIESEPSLRLAAAFDSVRPALAWLENETVDVLLTDLGLPDGSGIEIIQACSRRYPDCDIMVLTTSSDEEDVLASIEAGASGYLLKGSHKNDIVRSVQTLLDGGAPMSPTIARLVLARIRVAKPEAASVAAHSDEATVVLTKKETAILDLIARGDSYGDIAQMLHVTVGTVQTHIKNIYGKLSVHSRGEAVFEAQRQGLLKVSTGKNQH